MVIDSNMSSWRGRAIADGRFPDALGEWKEQRRFLIAVARCEMSMFRWLSATNV